MEKDLSLKGGKKKVFWTHCERLADRVDAARAGAGSDSQNVVHNGLNNSEEGCVCLTYLSER